MITGLPYIITTSFNRQRYTRCVAVHKNATLKSTFVRTAYSICMQCLSYGKPTVDRQEIGQIGPPNGASSSTDGLLGLLVQDCTVLQQQWTALQGGMRYCRNLECSSIIDASMTSPRRASGGMGLKERLSRWMR